MKSYNGRLVVRDVSLEVASGEVIGLLGRNGAGKTTCFYMIAGLVASDGGTIELDSSSISRLPIHRRARLGVARTFQRLEVFGSLTAYENMLAAAEFRRS